MKQKGCGSSKTQGLLSILVRPKRRPRLSSYNRFSGKGRVELPCQCVSCSKTTAGCRPSLDTVSVSPYVSFNLPKWERRRTRSSWRNPQTVSLPWHEDDFSHDPLGTKDTGSRPQNVQSRMTFPTGCDRSRVVRSDPVSPVGRSRSRRDGCRCTDAWSTWRRFHSRRLTKGSWTEWRIQGCPDEVSVVRVLFRGQ